MKIKTLSISLLTLISLSSLSVFPAFAQSTYDESQKNFAVALEKSIADIETATTNLNQNEKDLSIIHASLPGDELYNLMKPELDEYDSKMSEQVKQILSGLGDNVKNSANTQAAQNYLDGAKQILENAKIAVLGKTLANNIQFKIMIIKELLESSIGEYEESVSDGKITTMPSFQEGSGFVLHSQELYSDMKPQLSADQVVAIEKAYSDLADAYNKKAPLSDVDPLTDKVKDAFGGEEQESNNTDMSVYLTNVKNLLNRAKDEYSQGNSDKAQILATQAYLSNFEYLEPTLAKSNQTLEHDLEKMIREDLRGMIKSGASVSDVSAEIDSIQSKLDQVATIVPEFGPIVGSIFVLSIAAIVAIRMKRNIFMPRI